MLIFYFHVNGGTWKAVFFNSGFIKVCGSLVIASLISFESCPNVFCGASRKYNGWTFTSWMELRKIRHARFLKRWSSFYLDFPHGVNWWKERCLLPPGFFLDILQVCWEVSLPLWGLSQPLGRRGWLHCAPGSGLAGYLHDSLQEAMYWRFGGVCFTTCCLPTVSGGVLSSLLSPESLSDAGIHGVQEKYFTNGSVSEQRVLLTVYCWCVATETPPPPVTTLPSLAGKQLPRPDLPGRWTQLSQRRCPPCLLFHPEQVPLPLGKPTSWSQMPASTHGRHPWWLRG